MNIKNMANKTMVIGCCLLATGACLTACSNDIDVAQVSEGQYVKTEQNLVFLSDKYGASGQDDLIFNENGSTDFYVNLRDAAASEQTFTVSYDLKALDNYNAANGTAYEALPAELVTIGGEAKVAKGQKQSEAVKVSFTSADNLEKNGVYAIPLKVSGAAAQTSADKGEFVLLVRDITKMPNCHKEGGLQVISCMEVNDDNPLFNMCFTLENSGKYFFDQVILFSGNINYNAETQEVYNYNNENVAHLLKNSEKYLKPLQEKGMKVILGILGNHDRSAITNLSNEGCKKFAAELKAVVDAYNLDGIFWDDEYSSPGNYPGFVSGNNWSRLCYECKRAMPDKLQEAYVYSGTRSASAITDEDGVVHQPGEFVDYAIHDYGGSSDVSSNYPGMPKTSMILYSMEFARGYYSSQSSFERVKNEGFGGTMIFSLGPSKTRLTYMNYVAQAFYGENVVQTGTYGKDW